MAWDFETDPDFQNDLDWMSEFVSEEIEPVDMIIDHPNDFRDPNREKLIKPLQDRVQERGLWACHLDPDIGGPGYGQLKLALMNEILGRSKCAPVVFGCQAPDSGNAEIIARYGTEEQKQQYLEPLLANTMCSAYSMTEPQGGADPKVFKCRAELIGDEWAINGEKWFSSNARYAELLVVMAVSNPDAPTYERMSMFQSTARSGSPRTRATQSSWWSWRFRIRTHRHTNACPCFSFPWTLLVSRSFATWPLGTRRKALTPTFATTT
jgi:acyl-CoA dehydrogenase